jgi:hypothetical protein
MQLLKLNTEKSLIDGCDAPQDHRQGEVLLNLNVVHLVVALQKLKGESEERKRDRERSTLFS